MAYAITTDSSFDNYASQSVHDSIEVILHTFTIGEKNYTDAFETDQQYEKLHFLSNNSNIKIRPPSKSDFEEFFDSILERYDALIHISVSSKLSGAYDNAVRASKNSMIKFPKKQIYIIDSNNFASGLKSLVYKAVNYKNNFGGKAEDALIHLEMCKNNIVTLVLFDSILQISKDAKSDSAAHLYKPLCIYNNETGFKKLTLCKGKLAIIKKLTAAINNNILPDCDSVYMVSTGRFDICSALSDSLSPQRNYNFNIHWGGGVTASIIGNNAVCVSFDAKPDLSF